MARTVLLGKAEQKKIDAMKATNEALDAGITTTKPGNTADDVAQKFWAVLDKYNIKKESRTGYSIGIGYPPDWGEHTLNIFKRRYNYFTTKCYFPYDSSNAIW